jgi:hypothetical protein
MIAAREYVADKTAMKGHVANGKPRSGRAHGVARKGPSVIATSGVQMVRANRN